MVGFSFISLLIDLALVAIFVFILVFFTKFGLDRALLKIGKAWLALACALVIGPWLTSLFENMFVRDLITNAVHTSLKDLIETNANGYNLAELFENLPENFVNFLDGLGASLTALEAEFGSYTEASDTIIRTMAERVAAPCIGVVSNVIGCIIGFLVPWLFMKWLDFEIRKDNSSVFFRFFDRVGGFLVGLTAGYAAVLGLCLLTRTIFQVVVAFDASVNVLHIYDRSYVFRFVAEFDTFGTIRHLVDTVADTVQHVVGG